MENPVIEKKPGIKDLIPFKGYIVKLIAYSISRFGDSLDSIAYGWMVYQLTGSKLLMGTLFAVNAIPNIIFSPIAGVYADRHSKKKIVVLGNFGRGIVVSLTALLFALKLLRPWHLFLFTFLNSTFESFIGPASTIINTYLVPKELYLAANSISSSATTFSEMIGLASAGAIIGCFGLSGAILIDGVTFFIAAIFIALIKMNEDKIQNLIFSIKSYLNDLKEGFAFVRKSSFILKIIILAALVNFFLSPINVLQPAFAKDILKGGPNALSYIGVGFMIGSILGGIIVGQVGSRFKIGSLITGGIGSFGICYCLLSIPGSINIFNISPVILAAVAYFLMGFTLPFANSPLSAYLMSYTPKEILGRVSSLMGMLCTCMIPLGSAATGVVSEYVSIPVLYLSTGLIITLLCIIMFFDKDMSNAQ